MSIAGTDGFLLFLNLHLVKVCDFPLNRLNGFALVDTADMEIDNHARSRSRMSDKMRSFSSGASICKNDTAPILRPIRTCAPLRNGTTAGQ